MKHRGLIIAGTQSSSGKTLINAMILSALRKRSLSVQPFKTGPDYIDTAYSSQFAGKDCYNLDFWLMGKEAIVDLARRKTDASLGVVEGVMGLFDGVNPYSNAGSTCSLSELLGWPVFLVIPAAKQGRSIRATIKGFMAEAGEGRIQGIILNKVSGVSHADYIKKALSDLPIPVVGAIPLLEGVAWPERHLGLRASQEFDLIATEKLAAYAGQYLEIDRMLSLASSVLPEGKKDSIQKKNLFGKGKRLGVARDEVFHFYYQENLEALRGWGFDLIEFSPLNDKELPRDLDGIILGGGFPEVYADRLEKNQSIKAEIARYIRSGGPCYAECGGFMYLCEGIVHLDGCCNAMVGIVPGNVHMADGLRDFGYAECCFEREGFEYRAHEFHYSYWEDEASQANLWRVRKASRKTERLEGYGLPHLHASYLHLYFPGAEPLFRKLFGHSPR